MSAEKTITAAVQEKSAPNLVFVGRKLKRQPETRGYRDGRDFVAMPPDEVQEKPFYHAEPARVIRLSGGLYKRFVPDARPQTDLPLDFPLREILRGENLDLQKVSTMTSDELVKIKGIKQKSAEKILEYLKNAGADTQGQAKTEKSEGENS